MKQIIVSLAILFTLVGCAPKMGKDILIEHEGSVRLESSGSEVLLGILTMFGVRSDKEQIKIATDIKITNRWHSDITIISLDYALSDEKGVLAKGEAKIDASKPMIVCVGDQKLVPLEFKIDTENMKLSRIKGVFQSNHAMFLKGKAVLMVWGVKKEYPFERDVTKHLAQLISNIKPG